MAMKVTKADADEFNFQTVAEFRDFLTTTGYASVSDYRISLYSTVRSPDEYEDNMTTLAEDTRTEEDNVPESPETPDSTKERRDLSPEALGFTLEGVEVPDEIPDFATRDSKYAMYFAALKASYGDGKWRKVTNIPDPEALGDALRNAAVRIDLGLEVRLGRTDDGQELTGEVYFLAREKREKKTADLGAAQE